MRGRTHRWRMFWKKLVCLHSGSTEVRRQTIAAYIVDRPIFNLCVGEERRRGTSPRLWWWEQPMDLDLARGDSDDEPGVAEDDASMGDDESSEG